MSLQEVLITFARYQPLPTKTTIRILILEAGKPDDDIYVWLIPADLDADHDIYPLTVPGAPIRTALNTRARVLGGGFRNFVSRLDLYKTPSGSLAINPFQRYTALSYVWGDPNDPEYVVVNGFDRVPVTRNLFRMLKALRSRDAGLPLWIDALCINQRNHQERAAQIGLMRRVYQQAQTVFCYIPLAKVDADRVVELCTLLLDAGRQLFEQKENETGLASTEAEIWESSRLFRKYRDMQNFKSALDIHSDYIDSEAAGQIKTPWMLTETIDHTTRSTFLEDGKEIPHYESPLWCSWRRFFASPYFTRMWVLQEFCLANDLILCTGTEFLSFTTIAAAQHVVRVFSGVDGAGYLGYSCHGDPADLHREALIGWHGFLMMSQGRAPEMVGTLIEKLRGARFLNATDPRDKVYGLLGLAYDGYDFFNHISYAPDETPNRTFTRFAKLFIEKGQIFEDWSKKGSRPQERIARRGRSTQYMTTKFVGDDQLVIRGVMIDQIEAVSDMGFTSDLDYDEDVPSNGEARDAWHNGFIKGFLLLFDALVKDEESFQWVTESMFELLIDKERVSTAFSPPHLCDPKDKKTLRDGFDFLMRRVSVWAGQLDEPDAGHGLSCVDISSGDLYRFYRRAKGITNHSRICVTSSGSAGLCPNRVKVGDTVVRFEGSPDYYLVRRVAPALTQNGKGGDTYNLVGQASFVGMSVSAESKEIVLV
ncbi:uncharacterized protein N0V89_010536 [Didymosphaeria variabile]|uniref:Heterokaryon incompatibility domain-containing protein n=1 Tax=Didymosphaeria variabile TaxID=1932322 RepID=A0A9W8XBI1_9PLEO|nr:uncharacterized protein N0V89_010536 [Didymosphaeria variabile]KAJ4346605.1 hypothetical protein N0V89_010536 [Didymosphaeria variabile]